MRVCVSGRRILVYASLQHTIRLKKRGAVNCIVLHKVIYEAAIAGETGGVSGQSRQDPRTR